MVIENYNINLSSEKNIDIYHQVDERLRIQTNGSILEISGKNIGEILPSTDAIVDISEKALTQYYSSLQYLLEPINEAGENQEGLDKKIILPPKLEFMKLALEKLFGVKLDITEIKGIDIPNTGIEEMDPNRGIHPIQDWGIQYTYQETERRRELLSLSANGTIQAEGGTTVELSLSFEFIKEEVNQLFIEYSAGNIEVDPLILNFDNKGAHFDNEYISFDLDRDGVNEDIPVLSKGSSFLVLDINNNDIVDDGRELFGPSMNDGFQELSTYDMDHNDWIDEADPIFFHLKLWTKAASGKMEMSDLRDFGVGAIYLKRIDTNLSLDQGTIRQSSIFIKENGEIGISQEIDIKVAKQ